MSLANIQTLSAHSVAAVEAGRNLSDVLAEIWRDHPQLSAQERGALQDIAYGCQRFSGSLRAIRGSQRNPLWIGIMRRLPHNLPPCSTDFAIYPSIRLISKK